MADAVDNGREVLQHTFSKGLKLDSRPEFVEKDAYTYANNAVFYTRDNTEFGIANEASLNECAAFPKDVIGISFIEERNWSIGITKSGVMYKHDHRNCKQEKFFDPAEFNCDFGCTDCEKVEMQFKTMDPCSELYAYFSCGCIYYRVNIDLMLDTKRKNGLKRELECDNCSEGGNCEYFKIFKCACSPKITPKSYNTGGGILPAGAYQFAVRLKHTDGSYTNWFNHSEPVFVGSKHNSPGENSNGHIAINMSCLDCNFAAAEIAVIERVAGTVTAKKLDTINYGNHHYTYNYTGQDGVPLSLTELALGSKGETYLEGKYMKQHQSRMLYYGLRHFKNLNYQYKANSIVTGYKVYEIPVEHAEKYNIRGLMRGETYAFAIVWNYKDGTHSRAFHIPGVPSGSVGPTTQGLSQTFVDTFNPDSSGGGGGGTSGVGDVGFNFGDTAGIACEYTDADEYSVGYKSNNNQLTINQLGPNGRLVDCIKDCLEQEKPIILYITDQNGQKADYNVQSLVSCTKNEIVLNIAENIQQSGTACQVVVFHTNNTTGGGGTNSGGGGYSGQSQPSLGSNPIEITTPQCVIRKRASIPDDIYHPENDEKHQAILDQIQQITTRAPMDCEELKLLEDERRAACCNCKAKNEVFQPVSCGDPGTISVTQTNPEIEDEEGNIIQEGSTQTVSAEIPAGCAAPFVCCATDPMCDPGAAYRQCLADTANVDQIDAIQLDTLTNLALDEMDLVLNSSNSVDAAITLQLAIINRERIERKSQKWEVNAATKYQSGGIDPTAKDNVEFGGPYTDCCGKKETEIEIRVISSGKTKPDFEKDIKYPCSMDCAGTPLYGGLADSPVSHHQFPDACQEPHYTSKSVGVPGGRFCPGANEYEGFVNVMGPTFDNITWPTDSELPKPLCERNPYTVVMVKRTDSNKKVLLKAMATGTFQINCREGQKGGALHPNHGLNSYVRVSPYHVGRNECFPRISGCGPGDAHNLWSLDGCIRKPALNVDTIREELKLSGVGERYGLYSQGEEPEDSWNGSRKDKLGAHQAINLSNRETGDCIDRNINYKTYVPAKGSGQRANITAPQGGDKPLVQAFQQESIWIGSDLPQITDRSFVGDVLEHNAPITQAEASYVSLRRNLDNQYGALQNLNYYPILQAGKNSGTHIEGPVGDTFIGPYSFVKTSWVSDRVGKCEDDDGCQGKYNVPAMVPSKQERRCICDSPDDAIISHTGQSVWTTLPESGDTADPKNWSGLHTVPTAFTPTFSQADGSPVITDHYYPQVVTTNITFWGESEVNPWLREKGDNLRDQFYPEIDSQYQFTTGSETDGTGGTWETSYLNQFGPCQTQPSNRQRFMKALIRTSITIIAPLLNGTAKAIDSLPYLMSLGQSPQQTSVQELAESVLFTNEQIDQLLGIPSCKTDVNSIGQNRLKGFFTNPCRYNWEYSAVNDIYLHCGMPNDYYVCDCSNCALDNQTNNTIYYSEEQQQGSSFDGYTVVKPFNKVDIDPSEGKLVNIFEQNGSLFYHTTDILRPLQHGRVALASSVGEVVLGTGGFLQHTGGGGPVEGFAGMQHHNHHINTQWGYFFIDQEAAKIYRMFNGQMSVLSDQGAFNFFKEHLPFCKETDCKNEHVKGTSYYSMGVDPRLERFFVTKRDGDSSGDFTLSYDLRRGVWVSFHDYHPRIYNWDRYDGYIMTDDGYWKFHKDCEFGNYCGIKGKFIVEFPVSHTDNFDYEYTKVRLLTEKCVGGTWAKDLDIFFDRVVLYNSSQSTGYLPTQIVSDNEGTDENQYELIKEGKLKVYKNQRCWNFNEIADLVDVSCNDCYAVIEKKTCETTHSINQGIIDCTVLNKQDYRNRKLSDKFIVHRYEYDNNDGDKQLVLISNTNFIEPT